MTKSEHQILREILKKLIPIMKTRKRPGLEKHMEQEYQNAVSQPDAQCERWVTDALGFRLEVVIFIGAFPQMGEHRTYEVFDTGKVDREAVHQIKISEGLDAASVSMVSAHEAYHLFYSIRHLITANEETQAEVFGELVRRIYHLNFLRASDIASAGNECLLNTQNRQVSESYVTTEGACSNCGVKLSNAETSRLKWQDEAHRLSMENERLKHACNTLQVQFDALAQAHQSKVSEIDRTIGELRQQLSIYSTLRNPAIAESYKPI